MLICGLQKVKLCHKKWQLFYAFCFFLISGCSDEYIVELDTKVVSFTWVVIVICQSVSLCLQPHLLDIVLIGLSLAPL